MQDRMGGFKGRAEISQLASSGKYTKKGFTWKFTYSHFLSPLPIGYLAQLFFLFLFSFCYMPNKNIKHFPCFFLFSQKHV